MKTKRLTDVRFSSVDVWSVLLPLGGAALLLLLFVVLIGLLLSLPLGGAAFLLSSIGWCCVASSFFGWCCFSTLGWCCFLFPFCCVVLLGLLLLWVVLAFSLSFWMELPSFPSFGWRCFSPLFCVGWCCLASSLLAKAWSQT